MDENLPKDSDNKPEDNKDKSKKSFWKKWNEWWRLTWESFIVEVQDRVLMSWKRLIKFAGIVLIPIIYGVICTVAFWNPIAKIGKSELIVMDDDVSVMLVTDNNSKNGQAGSSYTFGAVSGFNDLTTEENKDEILTVLTGVKHGDTDDKGYKKTNLKDNDIILDYNSHIDDSQDDDSQDDNATTIGIRDSADALKNDVERNKTTESILMNIKLNSDSPVFTLTGDSGNDSNNVAYQANDAGFNFQLMTAWQLLKGVMLPKTDSNKADKDYTFSTPIVNEQEQIALTNIRYSSDTKFNNDYWRKNKGYMQARIPYGYSANIINYINLGLQKAAMIRQGTASDDPSVKVITKKMGNIVDNLTPVKFWTTFERNFLFGYLFTALSGSLGSTAMAELPGMINTGLVSNIQNYISIDGARLLALIGGEGIQGNTNKIKIDERYVVSESTDLSKTAGNEEELKASALFGDVNTSDPNPTPEQVGGKFINSVTNIVNTVENEGFGDLGNIISGNSLDKVKKVIDDIKKAIDGLLGNGNKDVKNPNALIKASPVSFKNEPSTADVALVQLNKLVYQASTGDNDATGKLQNIIDAAWPILKTAGIVEGNEPQLKIHNLWSNAYGEKNVYVTSKDFNNNFNAFLADNPDLFFKAKTLEQVIPNILNQFAQDKFAGLSVDNLFIYGIQGESAGIYGIGLGEFFLTIGLYVGCLLQTFIFDRAKRLNKSKWSNWYISKYMLMIGIVIFQVTAEMWVVYAAGWDQYVTASGMVYAWLWMMFNAIVFVTIVQALWFSIKDEAVGRFLCVLVLVFSLAAGGGTFPAYTQFGFFEAIGPLVPFTYTLRGLGEIAYGISQKAVLGGDSTGDLRVAWNLEVLKNFGILWIYIAIFLPLGLFVGARGRMKEMNYGSHYGYAVAGAMKALGMDTSGFQVLRKVTRSGKKKYYYNWKSLPEGFNPELYFQCRKMYKFEGEFKWWTRKHHDFVQKPNYSDEDTVTRNE